MTKEALERANKTKKDIEFADEQIINIHALDVNSSFYEGHSTSGIPKGCIVLDVPGDGRKVIIPPELRQAFIDMMAGYYERMAQEKREEFNAI